EDRAAVGTLEASDHVEEGALARAVRTDDADDLADPDRDLVVLERHQAAKGLRQPSGLQQRLRVRGCLSRRHQRALPPAPASQSTFHDKIPTPKLQRQCQAWSHRGSY